VSETVATSLPSVALITVSPSACAVSSPRASIDATSVSRDDHTTSSIGSVIPAPLRALARSWKTPVTDTLTEAGKIKKPATISPPG
jgi:hypothetical protein